MKHSDYSLIPTFVAVMQEKNYTRAAKKLGISQSAVSQNVARLRDVFNDNLFVRGSHGVSATGFANDIYPTLASAVESIEYTLPEHKNFKPQECNKLFSIAALSSFGYRLLPELAVIMGELAPNARVKSELYSGQDIGNLLRFQQLDLVIEAKSDHYVQLRSEIILHDNLVIVCRNDHPRFVGGNISREQFLAEKHVVHTTHDKSKGYLVGFGISDEQVLRQRDVVWQSGSIMECVNVISQTDNIALLPKRLVASVMDDARVQFLDCTFIPDSIEVAMYWHPSRTHDPSHKWFRGALKKAVQNIS
jgi:DNA-binding transcriptional LysR family regulator